MRKLYRIFLIFILSLVHIVAIQAQSQMLSYADQQFQLGNFHHAADIYAKAFEKKQTYRSAKGAAESYLNLLDYGNSYVWWSKLFLNFSNELSVPDAEQFLRLAYTLELQDSALENLRALGFEIEAIDQSSMDFMLASYSPAKGINLKYFTELNNYNSADYLGDKDSDGNYYFVSDRTRSRGSKSMPLIRFDAKNKKFDKEFYDWTGREYLKIYKADQKNQIQELTFENFDFLNIGDPTYVKIDGNEYLFFTATKNVDKVRRKKHLVIHPELYFGKIDNGIITDIQSFPYNDFLNYSVITPFVDVESQRLFFASDMEGGYGGFDLYSVRFDKAFNFTSPSNLGELINTPGDERDPFLSQKDFYFSSNGHEGFGGFDIFQANQSSGNTFIGVSNLGMPFNTSKDDFGFKKYSKEEIYLSSNRYGDTGLDNIYKVVSELRQLLVRVIDCKGDLITDTHPQVYTASGDQLPMELNQEGEFLADLEPDSKYSLIIDKQGFFPINDLSISTIESSQKLIERSYRLIKIPHDLKVYSDIIYYNLDKSYIRDDAEERINKVFELLDKYQFLDLKVSSHTDSRASHEYNMALSRKRAEAVLENLRGKGIDPSRINLEWHGEEMLITDCPDGVPCNEDDHQLNRRSELSLSIIIKEGSIIPEGILDEDWCNESEIIKQFQESFQLPTIYFDFDKSNLRLNDRMELERLILIMQNNNIGISLQGHTDIRGSESYNKSLSERRAEIVFKYLINRNIDKSRLEYEWFGKSHPVIDCLSQNCSSEMHQLNRRTEIKLK